MFLRYLYLVAEHRRRVARFLEQAEKARAHQRAALFAKLRRNAASDFGRAHGFAQMRTVVDFRRQMPITDYEYYRPTIERVKRGEVSAMFGPGTKLLMFALTSGTTGQPKYVPITEQFFREYRAGWQLWGLGTYHDHCDLLWKRALQLSSDWRQEFTPAGTPCGNISGLAAETRPWVARSIFFLPRPVIKIHDPAAKHYTTLRLALAQRRLGLLVTANPTTLVELARRADRERESLVRDIHDGTLARRIEVPDAIRQQLAPWARRRDPRRARELDALITARGALLPRDAWPKLSLLAVWTGGSVGAFLPQVEEYYGRLPVRDHGLSASEGRMTIPLADGTRDGLLDYAHHYFEFIPEREHGAASPTVLEGHELEVGHNYYILLTTSSGFYRYDIHDVVRCTGFVGQAPRLEFLHKGAHFSNLTGEKLSEYQVIQAVTTSLAELQLPTELFTLAPIQDASPPYYALLVEPGPLVNQARALAAAIDARLTTLNCEYRDKRQSQRLGPIQVRSLPVGAWARMRQQRAAARGNFEEYKHPCLVNDPRFYEHLVSDSRKGSKHFVS